MKENLELESGYCDTIKQAIIPQPVTIHYDDNLVVYDTNQYYDSQYGFKEYNALENATKINNTVAACCWIELK